MSILFAKCIFRLYSSSSFFAYNLICNLYAFSDSNIVMFFFGMQNAFPMWFFFFA